MKKIFMGSLLVLAILGLVACASDPAMEEKSMSDDMSGDMNPSIAEIAVEDGRFVFGAAFRERKRSAF
mgnify:CR=1 FL=1